MTFSIRPFEAADVDWVRPIFLANARDNLTEEQRQKYGFVQGKMSPEMLASRADGPASVVAFDGDEGVGAVLTMHADDVIGGPIPALLAAAEAAGVTDFFIYGPGVVAEKARGGGALRAMNEYLFSHAEDKHGHRYKNAIGFVEKENAPSFAAHLKTGWTARGEFEFNGREFFLIARPVRLED